VLLAVVAFVQAEAEAEAVAETDPQFMGAPQPSGWGYHYQTHHPAYPASTAPLVTAPAVEGEGSEPTLPPVLNPYAGYGSGYGAYPYGAGAWNGGYGGHGGYGGYGGHGGYGGRGGYGGLGGYGGYGGYGAGAWNRGYGGNICISLKQVKKVTHIHLQLTANA
jgi:hypothetical protein